MYSVGQPHLQLAILWLLTGPIYGTLKPEMGKLISSQHP